LKFVNNQQNWVLLLCQSYESKLHLNRKMKMILDNFKFLFELYFRPQRAFSNIIDNGSLVFGAIAVLLVSFAFQFGVNARLREAYSTLQPARLNAQIYQQQSARNRLPKDYSDESLSIADRRASYQTFVTESQKSLIFGGYGAWFFSFSSTSMFGLLIALAIFYVPATVLLLTFFEPVGSFGVVLRRDYGALLTCTLMSWAAAHLPFALIGLALSNNRVDSNILFSLWLISGLWFGVLMIFSIRTVFGVRWASAVAVIGLSWLSINLGSRIFAYVSPYLFSPFLLFFAYYYLRNEAGVLSSAFSQRQNFRRFLDTAALNSHDAEVRVQLGLIYKQRQQIDLALKYFNEAVTIDPQEPDANYELGKIARQNNDLQKALEHFSIVAEQNDKYAQSEIWREIGATYFDAKAYSEAREFLEKFVERRPFDPEGLYYLGETLKFLGETERAQEMFKRCVEAVQTSPDYRRGQQRRWGKLAQKQLA
jgi:Tfp pilus assembly protein PilF